MSNIAARREAAEKLEATFLAEMLKSSGLGKSGQGGEGEEDHFASYQRDALAQAMVRKGGIGLAEMFFRAMAGRADG
ncbi:rod-binding protein [Roseovarius sp. C7]|uniref:rod-binding protein n=1 Tax=Roseovarius sp. C7 TaxID=3398643 RepID=UPI0039F6D94C